MDWSAVTAEDLVDALREVDWSAPPRPVPEFFSRFTAPPLLLQVDQPPQDALGYVPINVFESYRTNYFILIMFILGVGFIWKPIAILAAFMTGISIAFLNDRYRGMNNGDTQLLCITITCSFWRWTWTGSVDDATLGMQPSRSQISVHLDFSLTKNWSKNSM
ncbi:hypothetical protein GUJ93_ZPchr0010g7290 [Zizania palustris]|uniref:PRA1 family protein n=1 Tax=Zizania palustris TaxID=103762 RepID=A0A8J6BEN2_ZIZPA|nr:hypothetical protein GUJ93_ZPchr0010g7290 [Zizania palustris]